MRRSGFLALAGLPALGAMKSPVQNDADPAFYSATPALRVLLGTGEATPSGGGLFTFNGRLYRGTFSRLADGQIVNLVNLEQYLCSVVAGEMPSRWPSEALQAQSICARTYVLQRSDPRRDYDLIPSQLDQVYAGVAGETPEATAAVQATASTVLKYRANFARVAYSSCCGGHTEASSDAWGGLPIPYLGGVACAWCVQSPNYRWTRTLEMGELSSRLATDAIALGPVQEVRIAQRDRSGRVRQVEIIAQQGSTLLSGGALRRAIGTRELPSLLILQLQRDPTGNEMLAQGGGLGHGVGLCQWGARGMALAGRSAVDILSYYFPTTTLANSDR